MKILIAALAAFFMSGCATVPKEPAYLADEKYTGKFFPFTVIACKDSTVMETLYKVKIDSGVDQFMLEGGLLLKSGDCALARAGTVLINKMATDSFADTPVGKAYLITLIGGGVNGYYSVVVKRGEVEKSTYKKSGKDTGNYFKDGQII